MPDLDDIRAFTEVVDSGGLSRAGARLGMSKSMISRRLARLEAELGRPLLARTTRGMSLTEAGADFRPYAERMVAELQAARDALSRQGEATGRLRLTAPISFGALHLAPVLAELALRHPRLEISTSYSDRRVDLVGEGFDAAVRKKTSEAARLPRSGRRRRSRVAGHDRARCSPRNSATGPYSSFVATVRWSATRNRSWMKRTPAAVCAATASSVSEMFTSSSPSATHDISGVLRGASWSLTVPGAPTVLAPRAKRSGQRASSGTRAEPTHQVPLTTAQSASSGQWRATSAQTSNVSASAVPA